MSFTEERSQELPADFSQMRCQVGHYAFADGIVVPEFATCYATEIPGILLRYAENNTCIFSNNLDVVKHFDYETVVAISSSGERKSFKDHPQYEKWKNEFSVDEFYSMYGVDW